ncbi:hypothetical protein [Kordiimonas gwangyangensis]|uniref:hypothetical protein n=1 Tax=Kordiimonas gwangyangensis TaxID=288022 RepID=UPI00037645F3|nr:hypothetical protein [Kordiimonas gwangyangensis]
MKKQRAIILCFFAGAFFGVLTLRVFNFVGAEDRLPTEANTAPNGIEVHSNLGPSEFRINDRSEVTHFAGPIIYKTHAAYSSDFANGYGFPESYVSEELPKFVDYFAINIKYAGEFSSCSIKMLIDKDGPIALPDFDIYEVYSGGNLNMIRSGLPKRNPGPQEKLYQQQYRMQESEYDGKKGLADIVHSTFSLAGLADMSKPDGTHTFYTLNIEVLKHRLFSEWVYVELATYCSPMMKKTFAHDWVVLLAKPATEKGSFLPSPRSMNRSVQIPVPSVVKEAVRADLSMIRFE